MALVFVAEFDIGEGSTLRHAEPAGLLARAEDGAERAAVAELMLPEGSHHREADWTYFFLRPAADGQLSARCGEPAVAPPGEGWTEKSDQVGAAARPGWWHCLSVVQSRRDASRKRGANVKAAAIAVPHRWACALRPVLERLLDLAYAADAAPARSGPAATSPAAGEPASSKVNRLCKAAAAAVAALPLPSAEACPDWLERAAMRAARLAPGLSHGLPSSGRSAAVLATSRPPWASVALPVPALALPAEDGVGDCAAAQTPPPGALESAGGVERAEEAAATSARSGSRPTGEAAGGPPAVSASAAPAPIRLELDGEPGTAGEAASALRLVAAFGASVPRILAAVAAGARVIIVGGKATPAGDVAAIALAVAGAVEPALPGTVARCFPSASLTDLGFLETPGGFVAGVSNPLFRDRTAWWDLLCDAGTGAVTAGSAAGGGGKAVAAGSGAGGGAIGAGGEADGDAGAAWSASLLEAAARVVRAEAEPAAGPSNGSSSSSSGGDGGGGGGAGQSKAYAAAAAATGGSASDVAAASALLSGARFGETWVRSVAASHVERLCAMLDDTVLALSAPLDGRQARGEEASVRPISLPALPAGARAEAVRLTAIALSASYAERRAREAARCLRELRLYPASALGAWAAGRLAQAGRVSLEAKAVEAAAGSETSGSAIPGSAGTGVAADAGGDVPSFDVLRRRGGAGAEGLLRLARWASGDQRAGPGDEQGAVRRSLAALLCCCLGSERDGLRVAASFPETSGGLFPLAAPLLHRGVPERAFAAAVLDSLQGHSRPFVAGRGAALSPALLRALERSRPLAGAALGSRELLGLDAQLLAESSKAGGGGRDAGDEGEGATGGSAAHLAPFNPTSDAAVAAALQLLQLSPEDTLLDVGCGDGRVLVAASLASGCSCVGVETDPALVARAAARAEAAGVADRVRVIHADATATPLAELGATAVFLYLVPKGLAIVWPAVKPLLVSAGGIARAVTYVFRAPDGEAVESEVRLGPVSCFLYA